MAKTLVSIRMSEIERELLDALIEKTGATQASVVAMALRELAKKERVAIPTAPAKPEK